MQVHHQRGVVQLPESAGYRTHSVLLRPGDVLNRTQRRALERHQSSYFVLGADPFDPRAPGQGPEDFDAFTFRWAIKRAALVCVWGGGVPNRAEFFTSQLRAAVEDGWVVLVLARSERVGDWLAATEALRDPRTTRAMTTGEEKDLLPLGLHEVLG